MTKEFVPYQEALELKQLGFDEPCLGYYTHNEKLCRYGSNDNSVDFLICKKKDIYHTYLLAPTFSQAFRWFREKYKLHHSIDYECSQHDHKWGYNWSIYNYNQVVKTDEEYITSHPNAPAGEWVYDSDGEAELACLRKLIEIVKQNG